ncbi:monosaccharide ABC transporter membrane protein (CUT2 family) [Thermohydrogenium kirishiense]|nr:monosaccharide ABC transporter membrane protein (CUT2 family) [Thermohydrogenium kirishiense]
MKSDLLKIKDVLKKSSYVIALFAILIITILVFTLFNPLYISPQNLVNVVEETTINGILAIGVTFPIITGGIDLSVGSIMAVVDIVFGMMAVKGINPLLVILGCIFLGYIMGALNGVVITQMKLQPFIVTLSINSILRGIAYVISGGYPILNIPQRFRNLLYENLGYGIRISMLILFGVALICAFILKRTPAGTYIYALGSNEEATRLSGVNTSKYKIFAYIISGIAAALAGMIMVSRLGTGDPTTGVGYELNAIAAAAIGGASLAGGKGSIAGTMIGALILSALEAGLVLMGVNSFYQYIAIGLVIIIATYVETIQNSIASYISRHSKKRFSK